MKWLFLLIIPYLLVGCFGGEKYFLQTVRDVEGENVYFVPFGQCYSATEEYLNRFGYGRVNDRRSVFSDRKFDSYVRYSGVVEWAFVFDALEDCRKISGQKRINLSVLNE